MPASSGKNQGTKTADRLDAIEALRPRIIERHRQTHHLKSTVQFLCSRAVGCVERFIDGRTSPVSADGSVRIRAAAALFAKKEPP